MKRVLTFLAIMLLPLSVMAMTPISDNDMSKVTGQAGVSMTFDVTMNLNFGAMGWGDSDGVATIDNVALNTAIGGANTGGWIGLDSVNIRTLHIWPRTDYTMESGENTGTVSLTPTAGAARSGDGGWADLKWLTIDVVSLNSTLLSASQFGTTFLGTGGSVTAVRIGVPTLTVSMDDMAGNVVLADRSNVATIGGIVDGAYAYGHEIEKPNFNQLLGRFYVGGLDLATGGGEVLIFSGGKATISGAEVGSTLYGSGINIALNDVRIDYVLVDSVGWGDIDGAYDICEAGGLGDTTHLAHNTGSYGTGLCNPGWVGLTNVAVENIVIDGMISIQVGSYIGGSNFVTPGLSATSWHSLISCFDEAFAVTAAQHGNSFIFIGLKDVHVQMGQMAGTVELSDSTTYNPLFDGTQTLGDIYVGKMDMLIKNNPMTTSKSWFAIFAH